MAFVCRLSDGVRDAAAAGRPCAAVSLLRRFLHPEEGQQLRQERLKVIAGVADVAEPRYSLVQRQLVGSLNYKPFLSRTASSFYAAPERGYVEVDIDLHLWSAATLSAFKPLLSRMFKATQRAGIVVEAESDEQMPERMLMGAYISYLDPDARPPLPAEVVDYLVNDEAHTTPALPGSAVNR